MKLPTGVNVSADWKLAGVLIAGVVLLYYLAKREVGQAATAVGNALDVTAQNNVADKAVDKLTRAVTLRENDSLGWSVWRVFNPTDAARLDKYVKK